MSCGKTSRYTARNEMFLVFEPDDNKLRLKDNNNNSLSATIQLPGNDNVIMPARRRLD
ncbi:hypothetical protein J6590_093100 [Homalodisca vitripennis]|nr:hypothetical protein J6590_093100 [Homalodisca vitripennis]